jgi:hypothetical protein
VLPHIIYARRIRYLQDQHATIFAIDTSAVDPDSLPTGKLLTWTTNDQHAMNVPPITFATLFSLFNSLALVLVSQSMIVPPRQFYFYQATSEAIFISRSGGNATY